jgi:ABC-type multidrug transport system ATPase subunit
MELLYVWIEDYNNIYRQGFNFSPKHKFEFKPTEFDEKGNVTGGTLTHDDINTNYPDNFFGDHISNITAIVGKNGSGKSSLLFRLFYLNNLDEFKKTRCVAIFMHTEPNTFCLVSSIEKDCIAVDETSVILLEEEPNTSIIYSNQTISDAYTELYPLISNDKGNGKEWLRGHLLTPDVYMAFPQYESKVSNTEGVRPLTTYKDYKVWNQLRSFDVIGKHRDNTKPFPIPIPNFIKLDAGDEDVESIIIELEKGIIVDRQSDKVFVCKLGDAYGDNASSLEFFYTTLSGKREFEELPQQGISLSWVGLSAGEEAKLEVVTAIENARIRLNNDVENVIIMLDEPDTSLHPEWQQQIIRECTEYAVSSVKIQFIITTHSPILVSDLPRENIIFLDKDADGKCVVKEPVDMDRTFGANIHNLYRNSFFMNGLMGKFAEEKIQDVLECLNGNEDVDEDRKMYVRFIISQIGEPLIREMLLKKYDMKFHFNVEDRILTLEKELKMLKGKKK